MTPRELAFIRECAEGFRAALAALTAADGDTKLAEAIQQLQEPWPGPLRNRDIGYLAAMLMAWQDRGSPEIWT